MRVRVVLAGAGLALFAACSSFSADTPAPAAPTDGGATADAAAEASPTTPTCPGKGPKGVLIDAGGVRYCIDGTEVSGPQYREFADDVRVDTSHFPKNIPSACATKTGPRTAGAGSFTAGDGEPVRGVDWCDAAIYCAWAGKRLCGRLGREGKLTPEQADLVAISEWGNACSNGGKTTFAYGNEYVDGRCNNGALPVLPGSLPDCHGDHPDLFDLSGNIREWEDACDDSTPMQCLVRGGAFGDIPSTLACTNRQQIAFDDGPNIVGIRCCADPL